MNFQINLPDVSKGKNTEECCDDKDVLVDGEGTNEFDQVGLLFERCAPFQLWMELNLGRLYCDMIQYYFQIFRFLSLAHDALFLSSCSEQIKMIFPPSFSCCQLCLPLDVSASSPCLLIDIISCLDLSSFLYLIQLKQPLRFCDQNTPKLGLSK